MKDRDFLGEGKFTGRDITIRKALEEALKSDERKTVLGKISLYLSGIQMNNPRDMNRFRKRTASEVILSKRSNGCSDYAIVCAALAREAGIPAAYVEALEEKNLLTCSDDVSGHAFLDMFTDGRWRIYEPHEGFKEEYSINGRLYIPVGRGLDFSELFFGDKRFSLLSVDDIKTLRDRLNRDL